MDNISSTERFEQLERRLARAERRLRATWSLAFIGTLGAFVLGLNPEARAQFGVTLSSLNTRLALVENKTRFQSADATAKTTTFSGCNVLIQNGLNATNGNPDSPFSIDTTLVNGLGNLIVGYNEATGEDGDERGGSHNLVIGNYHDYTSFGGLVAGQGNRITGILASVSGGSGNTASGFYASVSGGGSNMASGARASVSGGSSNTASGVRASVSGGQVNAASAFAASISGGAQNTVSAQYASVSGGRGNDAAGQYSSVSGGQNRDIGNAASNADDWRAGSLSENF